MCVIIRDILAASLRPGNFGMFTPPTSMPGRCRMHDDVRTRAISSKSVSGNLQYRVFLSGYSRTHNRASSPFLQVAWDSPFAKWSRLPTPSSAIRGHTCSTRLITVVDMLWYKAENRKQGFTILSGLPLKPVKREGGLEKHEIDTAKGILLWDLPCSRLQTHITRPKPVKSRIRYYVWAKLISVVVSTQDC